MKQIEKTTNQFVIKSDMLYNLCVHVSHFDVLGCNARNNNPIFIFFELLF